MRAFLATTGMLLLAACGGKAEGNNSSDAAGATTEQAPANLQVDPGNMAVPLPAPSPKAIAGLPARFSGRWGMGAADCDPAKAYGAKGLMVVAGDRLTFYESRGVASGVAALNDDTVTAQVAMSGEGQRWQEPTRLTLTQDGRTLIRQAQGSPDRAGSFTYRKCPA